MNRTVKKPFAILLCAVYVLTVLMSAGVTANAREPDPILAERVDGAQLVPGDRIVIVSDAAQAAVSVNSEGTRLATADISIGSTATRQVLTAMDETAAIFEVLSANDGAVYLRCAQGYLTSTATGNGLSYAAEPALCSQWQLQKGGFLYNPNAVYTSNGRTYQNYYLEYYAKRITVYGKTNSSDPAAFTFSFYRLGNSRPEEHLLDSEEYRLSVFQTSDVHGSLADTGKEPHQYLLAYISDKVRDVRGDDRSRALLLDSGDIYQGTSLSNLLDGQSMAAAYQAMGYDAVTIGNHEFDWGIETTVDADGTMRDSTCAGFEVVNSVPVVISNLYRNGEKVSFAHDYLILEKTAESAQGDTLPVRIGVLGFAGQYASDIMYQRFTGAGYSIDPDCGKLNALARELEESGRCDATVVIAHEEAEKTALSLGADSAVDLVLGGHTHRSASGVTDWGLQYLQPSDVADAYTYSELVFLVDDGKPVFRQVANAETVSVTANSDKLVNTADNAQELDPALVALTDAVISAVSDVLNRDIGYITHSAQRLVYIPDSGGRSTSFGNWVTSIAQRIGEADVAFVNNGGLRTDLLVEEGQDRRIITYSDIYAMFPFSNEIYCYELTWGELLQALEYSLTERGATLLSQMSGVDCWYTGQTVNAIVLPDGRAVYANGQWRQGWEDRTVRVAMNNFIATTDRPAEGMSNPFCAWNETERLVSKERIDNEGAISVLAAEAAANDGLLSFDLEAHYINREYEGSVAEPIRFDDVPEDAWYAPAVEFGVGHGLFKGVSETRFAPDSPMTRAMLVTVLYRMEGAEATGENPFADVPDGAWYTDAVIWAAGADVVRGTGSGFSPDANVTREQIATMLYRYAKLRHIDTAGRTKPAFSDSDQIADWAEEAMEWAISAGLFQGNADGSLNPRGNATRAQVAALLQRFAGLDAPLSLWTNDARAARALYAFVEAVTDPTRDSFIPVRDRIAVFDLDGTLFCETDPNYFDYTLLKYRVLEDPDYRDKASDFEREVANKIKEQNETGNSFSGLEVDHGRAVASAFAGLSVAEFNAYIQEFKKQPMPSYTGMNRGGGFYQPMVQVVNYLQANDFTVYIVSGTDRLIVRGIIDGSPLDIPNRQIIGSDETIVSSNQAGKDGLDYVFAEGDELILGGDFLIKNLKMNKVSVIMQEIGQQPVLSFGNSTGDSSMAEYVTSCNPYPSLAFMLCCDDTERENGSQSKADKMYDLCSQFDWVPVSMKNDWTTIYGDGVTYTGAN